MSDQPQKSGRARNPRARRRVRWTVTVLALIALAIYGGFVGKGVLG